MITPENNIKLIDFGAARDYLDSGNRSLSVMLKPGFAPEEQYFARGQQGPWTDIYALCATIYRAITGITPPESVERLRNDTLKAPSALGIRISPAEETALLKGMAVSQEERWQTIPELNAALYGGDGKPLDSAQPAKPKKASPEKADSMAPDVPKQAPGGDTAPDQKEAVQGADDSSGAQKNWPKKSKSLKSVAYVGLALFAMVVIVVLLSAIPVFKITMRIESYLGDRNYDAAIALIQQIDTTTEVYDITFLHAAQVFFNAGEYVRADVAFSKLSPSNALKAAQLGDDIKCQKILSEFNSSDIDEAAKDLVRLQSTNETKAKELITDYATSLYDYAVSQYRHSRWESSYNTFILLLLQL